jgi:acyl-CoA reductase-like NAD-dependent aldehyde dehydrogenase
VCFTGSVAGGLAVKKAAADRIVHVGLELGGKDPAYVRSDVGIAWAAEEIVDGAIFNSGQSCCSLERVYVDESVHDQFVEAVQKVLSGYKLGDPFDKGTHIGPVISKRSKESIEEHIKDALDKGANDATPDNESFSNPPTKGNFMKPTLLTNVDHSMRVMTEETFGPVIPVMKVKGDKQAVELMNDSEFGLTASIWTKDNAKGYDLAEEVEAGTVFVNRCDYPSPVGLRMNDKGNLALHCRTDAMDEPPLTDRLLGSRVDRVQELWTGPDVGKVWIRSVCQIQELPPQGLPEIRDKAYITEA